MKPARIDASQTTTVAAIHVPMPLIERPSVTSVATINETSVAISATPPAQELPHVERAEEERLHEREDDRVDHDRCTNPVTSRLIPSRSVATTMSPMALSYEVRSPYARGGESRRDCNWPP